MVRYFYTDPLAAAWMAEHFGMRFVWVPSYAAIKVSLDLDDIINQLTDGLVRRFIVDSRSLHLLEPQLGDQGIDADGRQCRYIDDYDPAGWFIAGVPVTSFDRARGPVEIDKRAGKHFFWPELEAA